MRLYENEAKRVFEEAGIPVPKQFGIVYSVEEINQLNPTFPLMIKAAVLIGGRGKAGGIKKANNLEEAKKIAKELLQLRIKDYPVDRLLLEAAAPKGKEIYLGITIDPTTFDLVVIASAEGGVEIEEVARTRPEAIFRENITTNDPEIPEPIKKAIAEFIIQQLKTDSSIDYKSWSWNVESTLQDIASRLYRTFQQFDAKTCEINPLILTSSEAFAVDAKIVLDDNGLYRQGRLFEILGIDSKRHDVAEPTSFEKRAYQAGYPYVDLFPEGTQKDPNKLYVGLVPGGAGYGIFSIDEVANIGDRYFGGRVVPINFMDSGGGPPQNRVAEMFHLLMDHPLVDLIITSRFGGISSCDVFIRGLVQALRERYGIKRMIPVHGRMVGTDLPSARTYLEKAQVETPKELEQLTIVVGNEKIMFDVIKEGIVSAFKAKGWSL